MIERAKIEAAIKKATLETEDMPSMAAAMALLEVSLIRTLIEAAQELITIGDGPVMSEYMFLRAQNESLLAGIRKLYDDARAEQARQTKP